MRNTLPLSSFPLQALLVVQKKYQLFFSLVFFLLLLYKTFNLPYTAPMMAQEGIVQGLYFVLMMLRIRGGIIANRVSTPLYLDWKFFIYDRIYCSDNIKYCSWSIFPSHTILPFIDRNTDGAYYANLQWILTYF